MKHIKYFFKTLYTILSVLFYLIILISAGLYYIAAKLGEILLYIIYTIVVFGVVFVIICLIVEFIGNF